jgi:hypothetical protein
MASSRQLSNSEDDWTSLFKMGATSVVAPGASLYVQSGLNTPRWDPCLILICPYLSLDHQYVPIKTLARQRLR